MSNPIPDSGQHDIAGFEEEDDTTQRRSILIPIGIALVMIGLAWAIIVHFTYHKDFATGVILSTTVYPIHSNPPANSGMQVVGAKGEDDLYLLPLVEIRNHISLPIFIDSLSGEMTAADGTTYHCTGAQLKDFQPMYSAYPDLAHTQELTGDSPLQRDTQIETGSSAHGLAMIHFPVSQDVWEHRQSASMTVSFYHQAPLVIPFPASQ